MQIEYPTRVCKKSIPIEMIPVLHIYINNHTIKGQWCVQCIMATIFMCIRAEEPQVIADQDICELLHGKRVSENKKIH